MLELSKKILRQVSFDKMLFRKELRKNIKWLDKKEVVKLKIWSLATFTQHETIIKEIFSQIS